MTPDPIERCLHPVCSAQVVLANLASYVLKLEDAPCSAQSHFNHAVFALSEMCGDWNPSDADVVKVIQDAREHMAHYFERAKSPWPNDQATTSAPKVGSSATRLSLKCILAHWLACRIDWLERKGARLNNCFRGTFQHQADLGPLSRFKLWLGKHWTREYIEKRRNRW